MGCKRGLEALAEFKKRIYDSTFTKRAEGMSFVNSKPAAFKGLGKPCFGVVRKGKRAVADHLRQGGRHAVQIAEYLANELGPAST
jgi:hypothetical protein